MRALSRTGAVAFATLSAIACMAGAPAPAPLTAGRASGAAGVEATSAGRAKADPPWAIVYERECRGSITPPRLSPSSTLFTLCNAAFELETGTFRGNVSIGALALLDDDRALFNDYSDGLVLGRIDDSTGKGDVKVEAGSPAMVAVSLDGKRVAVLEEGEVEYEIALREIPTLREIWRAPLESAADALAFIDHADPIVLTDRDCRKLSCGKNCQKTECKTRGVFRVQKRGLVSLGERFDDIERLKTAGRRALIVREDGKRQLVSLPEGKTILSLPELPSDHDEEAATIALDPSGDRLAYVDGGLRVAKIAGERLVELHHAPSLEPTSLYFSPDGKWLFAERGDDVTVLREGGKAKPPLRASYPAPPAGFKSSIVRDDEQTFSDFESQSEILWPNQIARFENHDDFVQVWVFASDPAELGLDGSLEAWTHAALGRFEGADRSELKLTKSWNGSQGRSLEYASFVRGGCDPVDRYVRLTEKDGVLYRVVVEVQPGSKQAFVKPLLERFFDQPLGAPPKERKLARSPRTLPGPC